MKAYSPAKTIRELKSIAKKLGISTKLLGDHAPMFNGQAINLSWMLEEEMISDLLHELAHYVVAHPKERSKPNYGWSSAPVGPMVMQPHKRLSFFDKSSREFNEESVASCLGILGERALKDPDWEQTVEWHVWEWKDFWNAAGYLVQIELCTKDFVPKFLSGELPNFKGKAL